MIPPLCRIGMEASMGGPYSQDLGEMAAVDTGTEPFMRPPLCGVSRFLHLPSLDPARHDWAK
jgi:hypothetical protein